MRSILELATPADLEALLPYMRDYAQFDHLEFDQQTAATAMKGLLENPQFGRVAFICDPGTRCGYVALCYGYSLELGGREGFIDELFIDPQYRNQGLGSRALQAACDLARSDGIRALHLEVRRDNVDARRYYHRAGFAPRDRYDLLTRRLD